MDHEGFSDKTVLPPINLQDLLDAAKIEEVSARIKEIPKELNLEDMEDYVALRIHFIERMTKQLKYESKLDEEGYIQLLYHQLYMIMEALHSTLETVSCDSIDKLWVLSEMYWACNRILHIER